MGASFHHDAPPAATVTIVTPAEPVPSPLARSQPNEGAAYADIAMPRFVPLTVEGEELADLRVHRFAPELLLECPNLVRAVAEKGVAALEGLTAQQFSALLCFLNAAVIRPGFGFDFFVVANAALAIIEVGRSDYPWDSVAALEIFRAATDKIRAEPAKKRDRE